MNEQEIREQLKNVKGFLERQRLLKQLWKLENDDRQSKAEVAAAPQPNASRVGSRVAAPRAMAHVM